MTNPKPGDVELEPVHTGLGPDLATGKEPVELNRSTGVLVGPTKHGLKHEGAEVVANAGNGWYFRALEDGSINVAKYRIDGPHEFEKPLQELNLSRDQWNQLVVAMHVVKKKKSKSRSKSSKKKSRSSTTSRAKAKKPAKSKKAKR